MIGLIADIGGTNARFALVDADGSTREPLRLACRDYPTLPAACEDYLAKVGSANRPRVAAMAIASPILGDEVQMTNHVWSFSIEETRRQLHLDTLDVINDLAAVALAVPHLAGEDLIKIGSGEPVPHTAMGVVGAGTGIGMSAMIPTGLGWTPLSGEGGHATAPASDDREAAVISVLRRRFEHVSIERMVCGPGLVNIYFAIAELDGKEADPAMTPPECTKRALEQSCPIASEATAMFASLLGNVSGNLALTLNARGGIFIAGGIVPQLGETFLNSAFRTRFESKGRFTQYLQAIPTYLIVRDLPAFVGLAALVSGRGPHQAAGHVAK
jgi:glucokinase